MEEFFPDGSRAHCQVYLQLRRAVHQHIASKQEPILQECEKPTGTWRWQKQPDTSVVEEMELYAEGRDENEFADMMDAYMKRDK